MEKNMQKKIIVVVVIVLLCGVSFFAGTKFGGKAGAGKMPSDWQGKGLSAGGPGAGGRLGGGASQKGGMVNGDILSRDDKSITVKMGESGSRVVYFASSTAVTKSAVGALTDLLVGKKVMVVGTANSDGSVTAKSIQMLP